MTLERRLWVCAAACAALAPACWSQSVSAWRGYKMIDGLPEPACSAVTINVQGTVLARHLNVPSLTRLDGYSVTVLPAPPTRGGRCYESPAGQLWAASAEGLYELRQGEWVFHAVPEIAAESKKHYWPRGVPLFVVRHGRVLFLLPDRLCEWNAEDSERARVETLRLAHQTRLGRFLGLAPARDGGLWVSAQRGCAKLPGPIRALKVDAEWQEFLLPEAARVQDLREPRVDEADTLTAVGQTVEGQRPVVVRLEGQRWTTVAAGVAPLQFAWSGFGSTLWAATPTALLRWSEASGALLAEEEIAARRYWDLANEPGGAFWLATSDGLFRYSPPVWQSPAGVQAVHGPVQGLAGDAEGRLWFVAGGELHSFRDGQHQVHNLPEAVRPAAAAVRAFAALAEGSLLFVTEEQLFRFHPDNQDFSPVTPEGGEGQFRFLGMQGDGVAFLQRSASSAREAEYELATYDGLVSKPLTLSPAAPPLGSTLLAMFQARNGDLWLSGERGVACRRANQWKTFLAANERAPAAVTHFSEAVDGRLWGATTDRLWVFDGRDWSPVRAVFDHINDLLCRRDDTVWVASNSGLQRLTPAGWLDNGTEEGLPSAATRCLYEDRRGRLWVGTGQGVSLYHPHADLDPPRTEIFTAANPKVPELGSLVVSFGAVDKWKFTPRRRLLYSYRLDDLDWSPLQEADTVTLTDLSPGRHTFSVRAADRNGNLDPKPALLAFTVELPWFKETRLVLIAAVGGAMALFFAVLAMNRHLRLRRSYAEVERKVAERTQELERASQELLQSQKMKALGTLAAGIAHDFNSILSIVKGSAQIIEENLDQPAKIQTRLDRIKTVVDQGSGIVQAMLGFSRTTEGPAEPCNVNDIVESTITLLGDRFLRDVEVRFTPATTLPAVAVAKDLVQQVLLNFIFNAAESMSDHKLVVLETARLERLPANLVLKPAEAPTYVAISVRDSGCGIAPENLTRIFEPFFTTKALSSRRGTGLGLSMAYELAKRMQAGLAVDSAVGQGSTFTLILPALNQTSPP